MRNDHDGLFMAMTDATGGPLGGNAAEGADARDASDVEAGGDHTTNDGDLPGIADGATDGDAERANAGDSDVATRAGNEPGDGLDAAPGDPPYPGFVSDEDLATPGRIDPLEVEDDRMGQGPMRDLGIDTNLREEMLDNAVAYGLGDPPVNVNDERAFDDGLPGSWSDFSPVSPDAPEGAARFADPDHDAGGEVKGSRRNRPGAGGFDGGPPRRTPLPGDRDD